MTTNLLRHALGKNFGDASNEWLFKNYLPGIKSEDCWWSIDKTYTNTKTILGMGSIIDKMNKNDIVCGSGMISAKSFPKYKPNQVKEMLMVRGPLTYDKLISKGYKVKRVFGDPGLLFSDIYKSNVTKKHKIGIIPHFNDKNSIGVSKLIKLGCKYIDIEQADTPEKFLDELNECEVIFSSSLHGVIIGDSYEIPSYHIKFSNKIDDFKFRDYYASVKRPYSFVNAIKNIDLQTLEKNKSNYKCQYDKELIKQTIISVLS